MTISTPINECMAELEAQLTEEGYHKLRVMFSLLHYEHSFPEDDITLVMAWCLITGEFEKDPSFKVDFDILSEKTLAALKTMDEADFHQRLNEFKTNVYDNKAKNT